MSSEDRQVTPAEQRPNEARARSLIKIGACTSAAGIVLAVTGDNDVSRWLTVAGIVLLVWGLHRFGRLGGDRPSERSTTA
ncbi:MAG TPA: hypothetical protein VG937_36130 [Polyangiaceae bacterium]|jgi:hypothetical protein|nr:hypothetical protein [Polyangiaceae bacterium]